MIAHVVANMLRVPDAEVVVVTDEERIACAAREAGAEAFVSDREAASGSDRIRNWLEDSGRDWPARIVNVQADEPLLEPEAVGELLALLDSRPDVRVTTLLSREPTAVERADPNIVKAALLPDGRIEDFARLPLEDDAPVETAADLSCPQRHRWLVHVGVYAFRGDAFGAFTDLPPSTRERRERLEQLRVLDAGIPMHGVVFETQSLGVDTPADLERARRRLAARSSARAAR